MIAQEINEVGLRNKLHVLLNNMYNKRILFYPS